MAISKKIIAEYIILIIAIIAFGTIITYVLGSFPGNFNLPTNSAITSFYFTMQTISTLGYGDIYPISNIAKLFVVVLVISGLGIFLTGITIIGGDLMRERSDRSSGKIVSIERKFLRNHTVLIGSDSINMAIAKELKAKRKNFIMITSYKGMGDQLRGMGYKAYVAEQTSDYDMMHFELDKADKIIIDLRNNTKTVYSLLVVRKIAKDIPVIIVVNSQEVEAHLRSLGLKKNERIMDISTTMAGLIIDKL